MAHANPVKKYVRSELADAFSDMDCCIVVGFVGLSAEQMANVRNTLADIGADLRVVKNSLARLALSDCGRDAAGAILDGPCAIAAAADPAVLAKTITDWKDGSQTLEIRGGFLAGAGLSPDDVAELAKLPPKQVLLGMVAGAFAAPITSFAGALQAIIRKFVYAIQAVIDAQGGTEGSE